MPQVRQPYFPHKPISDYESKVPAIWREELLDVDNDNTIAVSILETCGPVTLMVYNRASDLAHKYIEMKEFRSLFVTAATCSSEFKKSQLLKLRNHISQGRLRRQTTSAVNLQESVATPVNLRNNTD